MHKPLRHVADQMRGCRLGLGQVVKAAEPDAALDQLFLIPVGEDHRAYPLGELV